MRGVHLAASPYVAAIDYYLPQTQCTQCGYPSCIAYAQAIADSSTTINRCPPGGNTTIQRLATLLGQSPIPLDKKRGSFNGVQKAFIVEKDCIGCTLCVQACPVDAIIGSRKMMHTVITDECTGCNLCVDPCPVDCIKMETAEVPADGDPSLWPGFSTQKIIRARERFYSRQKRLQRATISNRAQFDRQKIRAEILASVSRVHKRRSDKTQPSSE